MMTLPVHRIIPFSNVEGMGNRTSIFVQGCNANCLYCHNSETIPMTSEAAVQYTVADLVEVVKNSMPFIRGITVSGGEATLYPKFLTALFKEVHQLGLTCYVDTNGFYEDSQVEDLIQQTDKFLFDIKGLGPSMEQLCFSKALLNNDHRVKNFKDKFVLSETHFIHLKQLLQQDKVEEVRLVYIKGYYDEQQVVAKIADLIKDYPQVPLKLIKMHVRGLPKERLLMLKGAIPKTSEFEALVKEAMAMGIQKVIAID